MSTYSKKVKCKYYGEVTRQFCKTCPMPQKLRTQNCPYFQSISVGDVPPKRAFEKKELGRQVA